MADVWACSNCRSLNQGKDRCYKCRSPRALGGVAPTELPTIGPSAPIVPNVAYRSSAFRGFVASVGIISLAVVAVIWAVVSSYIIKPVVLDRTAVVSDAANATFSELWLLFGALIVVTLVAFAAWLSRVVANIPALTGSFPKATPRLTFLQVLVPILNLRWIPSILREVLRTLDPRGNGDALLAAAILPTFLAAFAYFAIRRFVTGAVIGGGLTVRQIIEMEGVFLQVTVGLATISAVMLVAIVMRVERRSSALAADRQTRA
jgi:hypothetical protein